jgi:hypothetical protein
MKKQKFPLSFALALIFTASFASTLPMRAYAGESGVSGTSDDSSSFFGDSNPTIQPAPGTGVSVNGNGIITVSPEVQQRLDQIACRLVLGSDFLAAMGQIGSSLPGYRISKQLINKLSNSLTALVEQCNTSATPSLLIAAKNNLVSSYVLAEKTKQPNVKITHLNTAISAYNDIVMSSNKQQLIELSNNEEFLTIGKVLKELRASLQN